MCPQAYRTLGRGPVFCLPVAYLLGSPGILPGATCGFLTQWSRVQITARECGVFPHSAFLRFTFISLFAHGFSRVFIPPQATQHLLSSALRRAFAKQAKCNLLADLLGQVEGSDQVRPSTFGARGVSSPRALLPSPRTTTELDLSRVLKLLPAWRPAPAPASGG